MVTPTEETKSTGSIKLGTRISSTKESQPVDLEADRRKKLKKPTCVKVTSS